MYNLKKPVEAYQCGVHPLDLVPEYFPKSIMRLVAEEGDKLWCAKLGAHTVFLTVEDFINTFEWIPEGDAYTAYQDSKVAEAKEYNDGNGY